MDRRKTRRTVHFDLYIVSDHLTLFLCNDIMLMAGFCASFCQSWSLEEFFVHRYITVANTFFQCDDIIGGRYIRFVAPSQILSHSGVVTFWHTVSNNMHTTYQMFLLSELVIKWFFAHRYITVGHSTFPVWWHYWWVVGWLQFTKGATLLKPLLWESSLRKNFDARPIWYCTARS